MQPTSQSNTHVFGHGFLQQRRARGPFTADAKPGGEAEQGDWAAWITGSGGNPSLQDAFGTNFFKYMVYDNAAWDFKTSTADHNVKLADDLYIVRVPGEAAGTGKTLRLIEGKEPSAARTLAMATSWRAATDRSRSWRVGLMPASPMLANSSSCSV